MDSHDAAYIAGFLDADGSIVVTEVYPPNSKSFLLVRVRIHQKDIKILLWVKEVTNIGSIHKSKDGMHCWTVAGPRACEFLRDIEGYIRVKKDKLEEALFVDEEAG